MSKIEKLIAAIRTNPKAVRFEDACKIAMLLGFEHEGGKGSHKVFKRKGEPTQLIFKTATARFHISKPCSL